MRRFFKQLFCAMRGHGGITTVGFPVYEGRCKKCGKIISLNPWE